MRCSTLGRLPLPLDRLLPYSNYSILQNCLVLGRRIRGAASLSEDLLSEPNLLSPASNPKELKGGLYLVATPIGNLEDITLRALRILKSATVILAEDTRHSAKLLQHYNITTPKISYHKFNEDSRQSMIIKRLERGEVLALISDAGMPGISDPGSDIVRACVEANLPVIPIPGPSAAITALVASGLPTHDFSFVGFLPPKPSLRQKRLVAAAHEVSTQILFVPPHKLCGIIDDCIVAFGSSRRCVVAREITKIHEEFYRGTLDSAKAEFKERNPRGEITLIIEGLPLGSLERFPSQEELEDRLKSLLDGGKSPGEATRMVADEIPLRRKLIYSTALRLSGDKLLNNDGC